MRAGYVRDFVWKNLDQVSVKQKQCSCWVNLSNFKFEDRGRILKTRSSWLNCALRDDEAVYWVSIGHYEAVAVDN